MGRIIVNGVPVSLSPAPQGYVATVGLFGLVSVWARTEEDALRQAVQLVNLPSVLAAA